MENCCQKNLAKSKKRHAYWSRTFKGAILRIGSRQSPTYYRVYKKNKGLEFELELKKGALKPFQKFLFSNRLTDFEEKVSEYFL